MKQIIAAARYNFMGFFRSSRTVIVFLISMVMCFWLSGTVVEETEHYGTTIQAAEAFIWTFGDAPSILLVSLLLIFLFADLPKLTAFTPFYLVRTTKRKWLAAQFLYIFFAAILYVFCLLAATTLLCMKYSYTANVWSETAAILAYSDAGKQTHIPAAVRAMESISPYGCMAQAGMLILGYSLTIGFLILLGNLHLGRSYGMLLAVGYSLYGFLLDPAVLGKLLGLKVYDMYLVRSAVGWISPLNHAVYAMHNFGYDNLPEVWQSIGIFGGILIVLCGLCIRELRRYQFTFSGNGS